MEKNGPLFLHGFEKLPFTAAERANLLQKHEWSKDLGLDKTELEHLAHYIYPYRGKRGAPVFREGDCESFMCLICIGEINIVKDDGLPSFSILSSLGPGSTVGEMALIDGEPRSASAFAASDAMLSVMTRSSFLQLAEEHPGIWGKLLFKIARLMSQRLRFTNQALVEHLHD